MKVSKSKLIKNIYLVLFIITPLIDSLNGFFIKSGYLSAISIGDFFRLTLILYVGYLWFNCISLKNFIIFLIIVAYLVIDCLLQILLQINTNSVFNEIMNIILWLMSIFFILSFQDINRRRIVLLEDIETIFDWWIFLTPLTLIIPYFLGLGYSTYYDIGYKGFYYATNAITYFLITLYIHSIHSCINRFTYKRLINIFLIAISIAMLGTKSGYVCLIILPLLVITIKFKSNLIKLIQTYSVGLIVFIATLLIFINFYSEQIVKILNRHTYFSQNATSFISFLTTGRIDRLSTYYNYVKNTPSFIFRLLFGSGYGLEKQLGAIEMDYFDLFFIFGFFGLLIYSLIIIYIFFLRNKTNNKNEIYLVAFLISIGFSFLGGHVLNNALSSTCFSMLCSLLIGKESGESTQNL